MVELEADRFQHLDYSEQTFQTEAKAVLGEYHKSAASPGLKIDEALYATAFTTHPYRHTTLGFYEDIQAMPQAYDVLEAVLRALVHARRHASSSWWATSTTRS